MKGIKSDPAAAMRLYIEQREQPLDALGESVGSGSATLMAEVDHPVAVALKRSGGSCSVGPVDMEIYMHSAVGRLAALTYRQGKQLRVDILAGPRYARGAVVVAPAHHRQIAACRRLPVIGLQQAEKRLFA